MDAGIHLPHHTTSTAKFVSAKSHVLQKVFYYFVYFYFYFCYTFTRGGSRIPKRGALLTRMNKPTLLATSTSNGSSFMGMYLILCPKVLD